jgi:hypothetical protein
MLMYQGKVPSGLLCTCFGFHNLGQIKFMQLYLEPRKRRNNCAFRIHTMCNVQQLSEMNSSCEKIKWIVTRRSGMKAWDEGTYVESIIVNGQRQDMIQYRYEKITRHHLVFLGCILVVDKIAEEWMCRRSRRTIYKRSAYPLHYLHCSNINIDINDPYGIINPS